MRGATPEADADADALFELSIPEHKRARVTWELSLELFELSAANGGLDEETRRGLRERRLPRSAYRVERIRLDDD
jgi:hypothetical protein